MALPHMGMKKNAIIRRVWILCSRLGSGSQSGITVQPRHTVHAQVKAYNTRVDFKIFQQTFQVKEAEFYTVSIWIMNLSVQ